MKTINNFGKALPLLAISGALTFMSACTANQMAADETRLNEQAAASGDESKPQAYDDAAVIKTEFTAETRRIIATADEKLNEWVAQVNDQAKEERAALKEQLRTLEEKRNDLAKEVSKLERADEETQWQEQKANVDLAAREVDSNLTKLMQAFEK